MEITLFGKWVLVEALGLSEWPGMAKQEKKLIHTVNEVEAKEEGDFAFAVVRQVSSEVEKLGPGDRVFFPNSHNRRFLEGFVVMNEGEIMGTYIE